MWTTMGCSAQVVYMPSYVGTQSVPEPFVTGMPGGGSYDPASAWWTFERLQRTIDKKYPAAIKHVQHVWASLEKGEKNDAKTVEEEALAAYDTGDTAEAALDSHQVLDRKALGRLRARHGHDRIRAGLGLYILVTSRFRQMKRSGNDVRSRRNWKLEEYLRQYCR